MVFYLIDPPPDYYQDHDDCYDEYFDTAAALEESGIEPPDFETWQAQLRRPRYQTPTPKVVVATDGVEEDVPF